MLGGVLDSLADDDEGGGGRRLQSKECVFGDIDSDCTCVLTKEGENIPGCTKPSCENKKRLCNGAFNFEYIADLRQGEFLMIPTYFVNNIYHVVSSLGFFSWL